MIKYIISLLIICVASISCKKDPTIDVSNISLDKKSAELYAGDKLVLSATITPDNAYNKNIEWKSSNETVATVLGGSVTAISVGETIITASIGTISATCKIIVKPNVYIVGAITEEEGGRAKAAYWKNGKPTILTDGSTHASVNCVIEHKGDIYMAGSDNLRAKVWKNGVAEPSLCNDTRFSAINAIALNGDDFYAVGAYFDDGLRRDVATVWKNGTAASIDDMNSMANDILFKNGKTYIVGNRTYATHTVVATMWIDGVDHELTDQLPDACVLSLCRSDNDSDPVRAVGYTNEQDTYYLQTWENEQQITITDGSHWSNGYSMITHKGDTYIAGYERNDALLIVATLWKNGKIFRRLDSGKENHSSANDIAIVGGKEYVVGKVESQQFVGKATLWIDGVKSWNEENYYDSDVSGMLVK